MPPVRSLSCYPVDGGPRERHGASRHHLSNEKNPPGAPPHRYLIDTAHLCFIINKQHPPMVLVFRAVPKPTTAPCFFQLRPPIPSAARRRASHIAGSQEEFRMLTLCECDAVSLAVSTAQGSCARDLCRDIEGKQLQPLLTTSSCRGGASYKQGQGAAPYM